MVRSARGFPSMDWRGDGHRYQTDLARHPEVTKVDYTDLPALVLKRFADVLPFYAVTIEGDEIRFVCARCRLTFSFPLNGRGATQPAHLGAHLVRHGVGPY